MLGQYVSVRMQ